MVAGGKRKRWTFVHNMSGLTTGQLAWSRRYGYPGDLKNRSQHWDMALHVAVVEIAQNEQESSSRTPDYVYRTDQEEEAYSDARCIESRIG